MEYTATTLILLIDDDRVLLAMKKRGFGKGRWNGAGGKLEPGETPEEACIRECQEEIGMTPIELDKVAYHEFLFPNGMTNVVTYVYTCQKWEGEPIETEEMAPAWFNFSDIPYDTMWQDDILWLPAILAGKKLRTRFTFDDQDNMLDAHINIVESLD
jgi:mutator protein MutT